MARPKIHHSASRSAQIQVANAAYAAAAEAAANAAAHAALYAAESAAHAVAAANAPDAGAAASAAEAASRAAQAAQAAANVAAKAANANHELPDSAATPSNHVNPPNDESEWDLQQEFDADYLTLDLEYPETLEELIEDNPSIDAERLTEYWNTFRWELPEALHWHNESAFLNPANRQYRERGINYDACTADQLKRLVNDRGLHDPYPAGITLKIFYIRVLEDAGAEWRVQLMDLPTELRCKIFSHLLTLQPTESDPDTEYCHPEVLGTCRQIYAEAKSILYDGNILYCECSSTEITAHETDNAIFINGRLLDFQYSFDRTDIFPQQLLQFSRLSLRISCNQQILRRPDPAPLNHMLCGLASFLMDSHSLKRLEILVSFSNAADDIVYERALYPLRRLRDIDQVTVFSNDPNFPLQIKKILSRDMAKSSPILNTMRYSQTLRGEVNAWLALARSVHCPDVHPLEQEIRAQLVRLQLIMDSLCVSSETEYDFQVHLFKLRELMKAAKEKSLTKALDLWSKKRKARRAFENDSVTGTCTREAPVKKKQKRGVFDAGRGRWMHEEDEEEEEDVTS